MWYQCAFKFFHWASGLRFVEGEICVKISVAQLRLKQNNYKCYFYNFLFE